MTQRIFASFLLLGISAWAVDPPPKTAQKPVSETLYGVTLTDQYRWLEDQKSPETRAWIEQQGAYTDKYLASLPGRDVVRARMEQLMRTDSMSSPNIVKDKMYFFMKRGRDENRMSICLRDGFEGKDEVLISPDSVSKDATVSIQMSDVSDDGDVLMYQVRQGGEDETEVRFFDVKKRQNLPDVFPRSRWFGVSLTPDGKQVYYSRVMPEGTRVFLHQMGTPFASDKLLFGKGKGRVPFDSINTSQDGKYLYHVVGYGSSGKNDVYVLDIKENYKPVLTIEGIDASFNARVFGKHIYVSTDWKAPNQRLLRMPVEKASLDTAEVIIPEREWPLQGTSFVDGKIYARYLENVKTRVVIHSPDGKVIGDLKAPGEGVMFGPGGRWDSKLGVITFTSFAEPGSIYVQNLNDGTRKLWFRPSIPVDPSQVEVKQVWYKSKDGTKVPMWLGYKKGLKLDGNNPAWLTGYGGFRLSSLPNFSATAAFWIEQGGVWALANLRGGSEFGEAWHKAGMMANKQNVFDDFIAAAEYLIENKYTKTPKLVIAGGSNGGLLVGAAMTQRPELFGAVVCSVPLLDMLRYQNLLLGRFWVSEYGSAENEEQFKYILKYSPYHKVEKGTKYPAVLFVSGDSDTRVDPMHARKMTALVQASTGSDKPVMIKYDTKAGHSGGKPLNVLIDDQADMLTWVLTQLGVTPK